AISHNAGASTVTVDVSNNLFHRVYASFFNAGLTTMNANVNNNTFRYGGLSFGRQGSGVWTANNNLFDHATPSSGYGSVGNSNNAYETGASTLPGAVNNKFV